MLNKIDVNVRKLKLAYWQAKLNKTGKRKLMARLNRIESIDDKSAQKLKSMGITTVESLLDAGATTARRKTLSKDSKINEKQLLKWVRHADLFRIKGIAGLKAELLEATGVSNMTQLAKKDPEKLREQMLEMNDKKNFVQRVPGMIQIKRWVQTARKLKTAVK